MAAGVILNASHEVLLALRPLHKHQGGLWEFPGGDSSIDDLRGYESPVVDMKFTRDGRTLATRGQNGEVKVWDVTARPAKERPHSKAAPKVQHFVLCRARDGKPMPNYLGVPQIKIFGTLHINPIHEGDAIGSLFQMDIERIEPMS